VGGVSALVCASSHRPLPEDGQWRDGGHNHARRQEGHSAIKLALSAELTAIVQYNAASRRCARTGATRGWASARKRGHEEMKQRRLIERIIFLDSTPVVDVGLKPQLGGTVKEQMEINLKDSRMRCANTNLAAKVCVAQNDDGSKALFERMILDEERHATILRRSCIPSRRWGIRPTTMSQQL